MRPFLSMASRWLTLAVTAAATVAPAWGQCAMCKAVAGSQKAAAILALNKGIILLAIPPAAIIIGMVWLTYRYRNSPQSPSTPLSHEKKR
jgi:hypothetical protein